MNGTSNSEIITSSQVLYARDEKIYNPIEWFDIACNRYGIEIFLPKFDLSI